MTTPHHGNPAGYRYYRTLRNFTYGSVGRYRTVPYLLEGVPGVAGVRPPLEGVLLVGPGVPGVADRPCALPARDRPGVPVPPPGVRGVPAVRLGVPAAEWDTRGPEDRRLPRPFGSMFWMEELAAVVPVAGAIG